MEIVVCDAEGHPAANRKLRIFEVRLSTFNNPDDPGPAEFETDTRGGLRVAVEAGLRRLNVRVPGVGFGGTGTFEVANRRVGRPDSPPLRELCPEPLATAADGTLVIRGLEGGTHRFQLDRDDASRTFQVPAIGGSPARQVFTIKAVARPSGASFR